MAFDTWTPPGAISLGSSFTDSDRVLKAEFGDGYKQIVADGLNATFAGGTVNFDQLDEADVTAIRTFWRSHGTHTPFLWTAPGDDTERLWRFTAPLTRGPKSPDSYSLSTQIEEAFDIA